MLEYLVNGEQLYISAAEREEFEKELIADGDEWEFVSEVKEGPLTEEEAAAETPTTQDFQTGPVEETAPAGPMTQEQQAAQDTGFQSEDGSLELQKVTELQKNKNKKIDSDKISFLSKLAIDLQAGSVGLGEMMASVPETLYDIMSLPQNLLEAATGLDVGTSSSKFKKEQKITNPILEFYENESIRLGSVQNIYNDANYDTIGIYDNFAKGNYTDGFKQLASGIVQSAPVSLSMMVGGAATTTGKLIAASTVGFAGPEIKEQFEISPEQSAFSAIVKGLGAAGAESVFSAIGSGTIGKVYKDILLKEGKEEGVQIFKKGLIEMYSTALKKFGAPAAMAGEGVEEVATVITQNMLKGKSPFEGVADAFIQGVGGGGLYGAPINTAKAIGAVKQGITSLKINKAVKNSEYESITDAFKTPNDLNNDLINLTELNGSLDFVKNKVGAEVKNASITEQEGSAILQNFTEIQQSNQQFNAANIDSSLKLKAVELLVEKKNVERSIKKINDPVLASGEKARLDEINESITEIVREGRSKKEIKSTKKASTILKQLGGKGIEEVADDAGLQDFFANANAEDQAIYDEAKAAAIEAGEKTFKVGDNDLSVDGNFESNLQGDGYGAFVTRVDGSTEVVINREAAFTDGIVNTGAHEVLHYALAETLKSGKTDIAQLKVGAALEGFLDTLQTSKDNEILGKRIAQYKKDKKISEGDTFEEVLTLLSETMLDGDIVYKESMGTKLMDIGRRLMSSLGYQVKFNTGKDVFNFIKDYNRAIQKGKLDRGLKKSLKEGIKGKLTNTTIKDQASKTKKQSVKLSATPNINKSSAVIKAEQKVADALTTLEEAEDALAEDYDNFNLEDKVAKLNKAYDQAVIELQNTEEDTESDAEIDDEIEADTKKEKIIRPKADKTKRRYSLDKDVKKDIEPKIAKAQAMNKDLIAQEKKLNKEAAEKIEKTNDKVEQRTIREEKLAELKRNPITLPKSTELNRLEREISKELKEPIGKAANLFTKLYYDKISDNAKTAVSRQEFLESAKAEIISLTINEFKPETTNRQGENVINDIEDIIFQRGGLRLRSLAQRLGVVGKDQGIARGSEALIKMADSSSDIDFDANDKDSVISEEKRKVSALIGQTNYDLAKDQVQEFWKENEGNTKVENFKKLPNLINNILSEMFGVTEGTLTARSGNLNRKDYANAIKTFTEKQAVFTVKEGDSKKEVRVPISEVSAFQDKLNEKKAGTKDFIYKREANESIAEALLRFLPKTSADDYTYASGRKGRFSGKSTGLPKNLMGLAYKIEGRKTTGIGNVERTAQKLTIEEIYDAIGAGFDADGNVVQKMGLSGKDKEGQTMLGLIKLLGRMVTNELSRTETDLDPMTKMDIAAGKNRLMHSLKIERGLKYIGVEVNTNLSEKNLNNTRNLFVDISEELGAQETVEYLVPLISRGYGSYYTKNGKIFFEPGRFSIFKNREDFFKNIDINNFKDFKSGDRKVVINDKDVTLKINFDQNAKNLNKFANQIAERQDFAKDQRKGLNKIAKILKSKLEEDFENNKDAVASILQTMNSNVDALIRTAAIPKFMFLETNETDYVYEHSKTASDTLVELSQLIFNTDSQIDFDKEFNEIMEDFVVSIIPKSYDNILNELYKTNGPREGDSKATYSKPLIKSKDGLPVRYTDTAFTSLLSKRGMSQMNLVPINKKELQNHLGSVKSSLKLIKENTALLPKNLRQEGITNNQAIKNAKNFDKAIQLGNSLDQPTKGISVWDFDDTLATTKSNVLYTMPGETTIYHGGSISSIKNITGSFTYFSQDKSQASEYAKGNDGEVNGFVLNESDIASEENVFKVIRELGIQPKEKGWTVDDSRLYELIDDRFEQSFSKSDLNKLTKALAINGIKASRFTDSDLKSGKDTDNIVVFDKKSIKEENKLTAADFAKKGDEMLANGAEFDFSEFSKVVKGEKGPFFEKAMARNKKFGNENVYVLTARPANSALAIHEFLKGIGLDIPLSNITGLANSNPQAKANWVVNKFAEGYNDFYFADDHIGNVKAVKEVLETLDVKSKVQQARVKSSKALDKRFNEIIEQESGIESYKNYETVKAGLKGRAKKFRTRFFIPPSAEDFLGLLYTTLPKGKQGDSALEFYKEHLLQPYAKAINGLRNGRIAMGKDYMAIKKEFGIVPRKLKKTFKYEDKNGDIKESLFSKEMAVRVHSWNSQGIEIPGLSKVDLPILVNYVNANPDLKAFSDKLVELKKGQEPAKLTDGWEAGTITSDLLNDLNTEGRKKLLEVWQQNVDVIFSQKNLNKLEAAYGKSYVKSLKDSLRRMKSGRNTTPSPNTVTDNFVMWLNGAIGNIMFLNRRSAALQMLSFTNFINFEGNNLYQASKAFANQPQYWKDWVYLMNSDYLVDRRDGLKINVNEADIATTAKEGGFQGVLAKVLQAGFLPTKMADSAAIATGGASFYRNKVNALVKDGMNLVAAEKQAMLDFIATAETSQQSSDPSKISKQQSEPIGRIILAFANTPSQYARIMKRSAQDLKNGRGKAGTHVSRIVYYGVLQNLMFNFLQQAMFAAMFGDDDATEEESEKQEASRDKKMINVANSMLDGILRGIGVGGAIFSVLKNLGIKLYRQSEKTRNKNYAKTITNELLKLSPPLSSKLSKLSRAGDAIEWGQKEIKHDKLSLKHPYVTASSLTVAGVTSLPLDRAVGMAIDAVDVASADTEAWMKPLIIMGWPKWQLESEEATAANRKAKKDRLKAAEEKEELDSLSEEEKVTKVLMDLKKDEQVKILISLGISKKFIREKLSKEKDRVKHIEKMRAKKKKNSLK